MRRAIALTLVPASFVLGLATPAHAEGGKNAAAKLERARSECVRKYDRLESQVVDAKSKVTASALDAAVIAALTGRLDAADTALQAGETKALAATTKVDLRAVCPPSVVLRAAAVSEPSTVLRDLKRAIKAAHRRGSGHEHDGTTTTSTSTTTTTTTLAPPA